MRATTKNGVNTGKANKRKILRMADAMADEAKARFVGELPDWAGLAWIIQPGWNNAARRVCSVMGTVWTARAEMLVKAIDIAWRGRVS